MSWKPRTFSRGVGCTRLRWTACFVMFASWGLALPLRAETRTIDEVRYPRSLWRTGVTAASGNDGSSPRVETHAGSQLSAGTQVGDYLRLGGTVSWAHTRATLDPELRPLTFDGLGAGPLLAVTAHTWSLDLSATLGYFGDRWSKSAQLIRPVFEGSYAASNHLMFKLGFTAMIRRARTDFFPTVGWIYKNGPWTLVGSLPFWANALVEVVPRFKLGLEGRLTSASYHLAAFGPKARAVVGIVFVGPRIQVEPINGVELGVGGGLAYNALVVPRDEVPGRGKAAAALNLDLNLTEALLNRPGENN